MSAQRVKYPRTPHLPWSPGLTTDDRMMEYPTLHALNDVPTVVTEKMDGGNVTLMRDAFYCRSLDSGTPPWEKYAKAMWARIAHDIPEGWRVSCESMWARRSVSYDNLPATLLVIGVWNETHLLSWDDTQEWAELLGLPTVPLLGRGVGTAYAQKLWESRRDTRVSEGFVVRDAGSVPIAEFGRRVAKWVRAGHVQTDADWRHRDDFTVNGFAQEVPA